MVKLYHPTLSHWAKMPRYGWLACHLMQQMQHLRCLLRCGHGWKIIGFLVRRYIWTSSKMIRMFHCHVSFSRGVPVGKLLDSLLPSWLSAGSGVAPNLNSRGSGGASWILFSMRVTLVSCVNHICSKIWSKKAGGCMMHDQHFGCLIIVQYCLSSLCLLVTIECLSYNFESCIIKQ